MQLPFPLGASCCLYQHFSFWKIQTDVCVCVCPGCSLLYTNANIKNRLGKWQILCSSFSPLTEKGAQKIRSDEDVYSV